MRPLPEALLVCATLATGCQVERPVGSPAGDTDEGDDDGSDGSEYGSGNIDDASCVPQAETACADGTDEDCDGIVLDLSRNRSRRYCSTLCSNRNAVAAYRARTTRSS